MALTSLTDNLDIVSALDDEPNDVGGLSATELKAKFDVAANLIKTYINGTLIPELAADGKLTADEYQTVTGEAYSA